MEKRADEDRPQVSIFDITLRNKDSPGLSEDVRYAGKKDSRTVVVDAPTTADSGDSVLLPTPTSSNRASPHPRPLPFKESIIAGKSNAPPPKISTRTRRRSHKLLLPLPAQSQQDMFAESPQHLPKDMFDQQQADSRSPVFGRPEKTFLFDERFSLIRDDQDMGGRR
jgi:hypothetical protein